MLHRGFALTCCLGLLMLTTACPEENNDTPPGDDNNNVSPNTSQNGATGNRAPIADPGLNIDSKVGERVEVSGASSTDPDGDIITPTWTLDAPDGSDATLGDEAGNFRVGFVPDIIGVYKLTLVVSDGKLESEPAPVFVRVTESGGMPDNRAPIADAGEDATFSLDQEIVVSGAGSSDPDGDELIYTWTLEQSPTDSQASLSSRTVQAPELLADLPGIYDLALVVNDGDLDSAPARVTITVRDTTSSNTAPIAGVDAPNTMLIGQEITLSSASSFDADGDALTFTWTLVSAPESSTSMIAASDQPTATFTADLPGSYDFELVANDGMDDSTPLAFSITATEESNEAPIAAAAAQLATAPGQTLLLDGSQSSDADGDALTFRWRLMQKPAGSAVLLDDANAEVASITPDVVGEYDIELVVNDGIEDSAPVAVKVTVAERPDTCLIISEYIEGRGNNKAIELYNCGNSPLNLAGKYVCLERDGTTSCNSALDLGPAGTLDVGDVFGVCNSQFEMNELDPGDCTLTGGAMSFNGDDRLVVFEDLNASQDFDVDDFILDAFGELGQDPVGREWEDTTYRRCDLTPLDGYTPFDVTAHYDDFFANDYSDLGIPPAPGVTCGAPPVNRAPVADSGAARNITAGQSVTLNGTASSDPDNDPISFLWSLTQVPAGSTATLSDATASSPSFVTDLEGDYIAELVVNDGQLDSAASSVTITALPPVVPGTGCILISEYLDGGGNNKAIELHNCGTDPIGLDDLRICVISNGDDTCSAIEDLSGQLLSNEVFGLCNSSLSMGLVDAGDCDVTSSVTNFNGNDRFLLYRENDGTEGFEPTMDEALDAFGETAVDPGKIWDDLSYRRCSASTYFGTGAFDVLNYYVPAMSNDDFSDFGEPPSLAGCP